MNIFSSERGDVLKALLETPKNTKLVGLFGDPVDHSLSPVIQNRAFAQLGLEMVYVPFCVDRSGLADAVRCARAFGMTGFNVTHPLKEAVIPHLDRLTGTASVVKAVNAVSLSAGGLVGHNTDAPGLTQALRLFASFSARGKRAVVLGSGGAARASVFSLLEDGAKTVRILARNDVAAGRITEEMSVVFHSAEVSTGKLCGDAKKLKSLLAGADLIVNATPVGMGGGSTGENSGGRNSTGENSPRTNTTGKNSTRKNGAGKNTTGESPLPFEALPAPPCLVFDLVYCPVRTTLLENARTLGLSTLGGLALLVCQASLSLEIWSGKRFDEKQMMSWLEKNIGEKEEK